MISVEDYATINEFVAAFVAEQKRNDPRFSYRKLAQMAHVSTPGFFQEICRNQRKIPNHLVPILTEVFSIEPEAHEYFLNLILDHRDKFDSEKNRRRREQDSAFLRRIGSQSICQSA